MGCLEDVVALIHCPPDPVANARAAIAARIDKHGGRVAARLGKEVSHIIWERRHSRRPSEKAADEADLLELFRKLEKVGAGCRRALGRWGGGRQPAPAADSRGCAPCCSTCRRPCCTRSSCHPHPPPRLLLF